MSTNFQDKSFHAALQVRLIERCLLTGNVSMGFLFTGPDTTACGHTVPANTIGGPPTGFNVQTVAWLGGFQSTIEDTLSTSGAGTNNAFAGGWRKASEAIVGIDATSDNYRHAVYADFSDLAHDINLNSSAALTAGKYNWRRQRPREAHFAAATTYTDGSGNVHLAWTPALVSGVAQDAQGNPVADGQKAWMLGTASCLAQWSAADNQWRYIGQGAGDMPDVLDSNNDYPNTILPGRAQQGDYAGSWLLDDLNAVLDAMTAFVVDMAPVGGPAPLFGLTGGTDPTFSKSFSLGVSTSGIGDLGAFGVVEANVQSNWAAAVPGTANAAAGYALNTPGAVASLRASDVSTPEYLTGRNAVVFQKARYGATFGLTAAIWGSVIDPAIVALFPAISGDVTLYCVASDNAVAATYPGWTDVATTIGVGTGDTNYCYGGNGLPGWAVQDHYASVAGVPGWAVDGTTYTTPYVGTDTLPGAVDFHFANEIAGKDYFYVRGWSVPNACIEIDCSGSFH